jgi:hypothetical protein
VKFLNAPSGNATTQSTRSQFGSIQLGLFNYQKSLNHGYGMRNENFSVLEIIKTEEEFMDYYLWLATALGNGFNDCVKCHRRSRTNHRFHLLDSPILQVPSVQRSVAGRTKEMELEG